MLSVTLRNIMANRRNKEYEHGYTMGYSYAEYEGGNETTAKREILSRGISLRTAYAAGFICGVRDCKSHLPRKYDY